MRTEQEYRNLEAENSSLRERLEKAEKERMNFAEALGDLSARACGVRRPNWVIETINAAIKAQKEATP